MTRPRTEWKLIHKDVCENEVDRLKEEKRRKLRPSHHTVQYVSPLSRVAIIRGQFAITIPTFLLETVEEASFSSTLKSTRAINLVVKLEKTVYSGIYAGNMLLYEGGGGSRRTQV